MTFTTRCLRKIFKEALSSDLFHLTGKIVDIEKDEKPSKKNDLALANTFSSGDIVELFGDYKDERVHVEIKKVFDKDKHTGVGKILQFGDGSYPSSDSYIEKKFESRDIVRVLKITNDKIRS